MLNHCIIMGRLTEDPTLRTTQSGKSVTSFTVAVDRDYGENKETDFIACTAWGGTAEFITKWFHRGSMAIVVGRLQSRKWKDKNGNNRTEWEIQTSSIHFGEAKRSEPEGIHEITDEEDIPF